MILNRILVGTNSGMGDCILMNGAVRHLETIFDSVSVLVIGPHNTYRQVRDMYRDNTHIDVIGEPPAHSFQQGDRKRLVWASRHPNWHLRTFWWPTSKFETKALESGLNPIRNCWPELFYTYVLGGGDHRKMGYEHRYESFYVERDYAREGVLKKRLGLPTDYAFVVDKGQPARNHFHIKPDTRFPIFKPHYRDDLFDEYTMFDWMGVIEDAREIYTIDTGWLHLIKQMRLDKPKFFFDRVKTPMSDHKLTRYLNDDWDGGWKVVA